MDKEKCLVTEAREKCNCESCEQYKRFRDMMIKQQAELNAHRIYYDALKEAGVVPR